MPNHVSNKLTISGPTEILKKLEEQVKGPDTAGEDCVFSFNQIKPMPEILKDLSAGTTLNYAIWLASEHIYQSKVEQDPMAVAVRAMLKSDPPDMLERFCGMFDCACATHAEAVEWARQNQPKLLDMGMRSVQGYMEHGALGWYDWSCANWGTKWDAYDIDFERDSDGRLIYVFDTAWSPPVPIVEELMEIFPGIAIEHRYFDEGHCFWGITVYSAYGSVEEYDSQERDRVPLCIELKGYDPSEDEEQPDVAMSITADGSPSILQ